MTNKKFKLASKATCPASVSTPVESMTKGLKIVADACATLESQTRTRKVN